MAKPNFQYEKRQKELEKKKKKEEKLARKQEKNVAEPNDSAEPLPDEGEISATDTPS